MVEEGEEVMVEVEEEVVMVDVEEEVMVEAEGEVVMVEDEDEKEATVSKL